MNRCNARRQARILGWTALLFVLLQLTGSVALDYVWPEVRFPLLAAMLERLQAEPCRPDAFVLGSSRFQSSLDAAELSHELRNLTGRSDFRVFHAAVGGSDAITMELAFNKILEAGHRPKFVFIEMTPVTIARDTRWYGMHINRLIRWDDLPTHCGEIVRAGEGGRLLLERFVPLYRHRYEICKTLRTRLNVFAPPPVLYAAAEPLASGMTDSEWRQHLTPRTLTAEEAGRGGSGVDMVSRELRHFGVPGNAHAALERILVRCQALGVTPFLVGAPVSQAFRETCTPVRNEYLRQLSDLTLKYDAPFFDTHAALPEHHFMDYHHTTKTGAIVFSRLLVRQQLAPLLAPERIVPAQTVVFPRP